MFSFHHVALSVSSLQRSILFYEQLGFRVVKEWRAEDASLRIAQLKSGETMLELFCYASPQPAPESSSELDSDLQRIGVKHFGICCDDIQVAKARLESQGLAGDIQVTHGRTGVDYFFIRDPDGIFVEVVQDNRDL